MDISPVANVIKVWGDVQGVFYRHHAQKKANEMNLDGWVKNEYDGSVSIFVQGEKSNVDEFIEWAKTGSPLARVSGVEVKKIEPKILKGFTVK